MRRIQQIMDGEIALPLPELSHAEEPAVANLALQAQDNLSRRIASVEPSMFFPATSLATKSANERARDRHRVMQGWHASNHMKRQLSKRSRYFLSYATAPVIIRPDLRTQTPRWHIRNPLDTLPATQEYDDFTPPDCIFVTNWTYAEIKAEFGEDVVKYVSKPITWNYDDDYANADVEFSIYEYIDAEERVLVLAGHKAPDGYYVSSPGTSAVQLFRAHNYADRCLAVIPGRITLSSQLGHFDGIVGMYQTQAALMALTVVAQRRTVWPREWLVARAGENPEVVSIPEPETGTPGEISGGELVVQNLDPSFRVLEVMDRLEENMRKDAGIPSEFGGLSNTNIRTGRRGAQVMGAAIDFTIAEAQDIFAEALNEENKIAIALDKAYFNRKKTIYIESRSYAGALDYKPSELWETDVHVVDYPIAGTDIQNLPIEGGQRVAMGTLSREGFMEIDPLIKDPRAEIQRMDQEAVKTAWFAGFQQLLGVPEAAMQLTDAMRVYELLGEGVQLFEAVKRVQREAQERQVTPVGPGAPEAQPGIAEPGQGVEQPEAVPEMDQSMNRMTQLLGTLGTVQTAQKFRGNQ
jgi:hypothetical protein